MSVTRRIRGRIGGRIGQLGQAGRISRIGRIDDERGDVPGWVLVTIMSAGLVAALWPFAETYLKQILEAALSSVAP